MGIEVTGWKPLDFVVGGVVTAGVAYGVYKYGFASKRIVKFGLFDTIDMDANNLQNCIALAGQPSDLESCLWPQPYTLQCQHLSANTRSCLNDVVQGSASGDVSGTSSAAISISPANSTPASPSPVAHARFDHSLISSSRPLQLDYTGTFRSMFQSLCAQSKEEFKNMLEQNKVRTTDKSPTLSSSSSPSPSLPHSPPPPPASSVPVAADDPSSAAEQEQSLPSNDQQASEASKKQHRRLPVVDTEGKTAEELAQQLHDYRVQVAGWMDDLESRMEQLEEIRIDMTTELHVTQEALILERRWREEEKRRRHHSEDLVESDSSLGPHGPRANMESMEANRLERQVEEMEEHLEQVYGHSLVTSRNALKDNTNEFQELAASLEDAQRRLMSQEQMLNDVDNEIANITQEIGKLKADGRQLDTENTRLNVNLQNGQRAARALIALVFERSAGKDLDLSELLEMANAQDNELELDQVLDSITVLLRHVVI